jgi:hypothetical protein
LSQDEIVFDEARYREPERMRRPDPDRCQTCLAYELPAPDDLPIFLDHHPVDAIERHAPRDTTVEFGGILLGKECLDECTGQPFVWIISSLKDKHGDNTQASFTYTTTRGSRSRASATGSIPAWTSLAGTTPIPISVSFYRLTTSSFTAISSRSRSRSPT